MPFQTGYYTDPSTVKTVYDSNGRRINTKKTITSKNPSPPPATASLPPVQPTNQNKAFPIGSASY